MTASRSKKKVAHASLPFGLTLGDTAVSALPAPPLIAALSRVRVESIVFTAIVGLALVMRLVGLDRVLFSPTEGRIASNALDLIRFVTPDAWLDAGATSLTAVVFFLFGATDTTARLLPVLAGVGMVLSSRLLRPYIGRTAALFTAALLATSALLTFASREVSSVALAGAASLVAVALLFRLVDRPANAVRYGLALAVAALLVTGATGFQTFLIIGIFVALQLANRRGADSVRTGLIRAWKDRMQLAGPAALAAALVAVLSSGILIYPAGAGLPAVAQWVRQFTGEGVVGPPAPFAQALIYDPLILTLGLAGAVLVLRRSDRTPFESFLLLWLAGNAVVVAIAGTRTTDSATMLLLPLAVLAGLALTRLAGHLQTFQPGQLALAILPFVTIGAFSAIVIAMVSRPGAAAVVQTTWIGGLVPPGGEAAQLWTLAIVIIALIALALGLGAYLFFRELTLSALATFGAGVLLFGTLHGYTRLNHEFYPELIAPAQPSWELGSLAGRILELNDRMVNRPFQVIIAPEFQHPLRWYLRNIPGVTVSSEGSAEAAVAVLPDGVSPRFPANTFLVERAIWVLHPPDGLPDGAAWLRWWLYGEHVPAEPSVNMFFRIPR